MAPSEIWAAAPERWLLIPGHPPGTRTRCLVDYGFEAVNRTKWPQEEEKEGRMEGEVWGSQTKMMAAGGSFVVVPGPQV